MKVSSPPFSPSMFSSPPPFTSSPSIKSSPVMHVITSLLPSPSSLYQMHEVAITGLAFLWDQVCVCVCVCVCVEGTCMCGVYEPSLSSGALHGGCALPHWKWSGRCNGVQTDQKSKSKSYKPMMSRQTSGSSSVLHVSFFCV